MEDSTNFTNMDFNPTNETLNSLSSSTSMEFEPIHEQPAKIKVIGVGGGGGNAVNHMFRQGIRGVDFIVCNTDAKALSASPVPNKIELGKLGAGNVPERARKAALDHKDEIRDAISNDTQMLFITAGMGGGTGTGAAPVIAEIAKSIELDDEMVPHILVVAIVTMPFSFEGKVRRSQALAGIEELKKHVDAILVINNDKLRDLCGDLPFNMAFSQADDVLLTAAKGIAEIITVSGYVNIDFRDVNTVMENSGTALMGAGEGRGDNRARQAIESATTSVLLNDNDIRGAKNILLYFSYSPTHQITMDEIGEVTDFLTDLIGNNEANIIWGNSEDDNLNDELRITLIATGFEQRPGPRVIQLPKDKQEPISAEKKENAQKESTNENIQAPVNTTDTKPVDVNDMHIIHKSAGVVEAATTVINNTPDNNDPFTAPANNGQQRVFVLEPVVEEEMEEVEAAAPEVTKATTSGISYLDEIRVLPAKDRAPQEPVSTEQPRNSNPYDVFAGLNMNTETVNEAAPAQHQAAKEIIAEQQVNNAMTPSDEINDFSVRSKAERIKKMNELLHNHPNGPKMVEELTTEQLGGEAVYDINHSAMSDAARTVINADGTMTRGMSFLTDLPD